MINILLPTDFSENAKTAADFVFRFFDVSQIRILMVHGVVPPRTTPGMMINIGQLIMKDAKRDLKVEENRLRETYGDFEMTTDAREGYLLDILPGYVRKHNIDMIVMGTQGENSIAAKLLGSNTEQVIRKGFAPVLAIPETISIQEKPHVCISTAKDHIPHEMDIERILEHIKDRHHVKFSVLHVLTSDNDKAHKSLPLTGMQIAVNTVRSNTPEDGIEQYLKDNVVDVMVVCHRHNSRLDYLFSRSTTKHLAGKITVPLLVLPDDHDK